MELNIDKPILSEQTNETRNENSKETCRKCGNNFKNKRGLTIQQKR